MVYTIGYRPVYMKGLSERGESFCKLGQEFEPDYYSGGSVWKTPEEAWDHLETNKELFKQYSVFEVDADWDTQTVPNISGVCHDLLETSQITREIPKAVLRVLKRIRSRKTNDGWQHIGVQIH